MKSLAALTLTFPVPLLFICVVRQAQYKSKKSRSNSVNHIPYYGSDENAVAFIALYTSTVLSAILSVPTPLRTLIFINIVKPRKLWQSPSLLIHHICEIKPPSFSIYPSTPTLRSTSRFVLSNNGSPRSTSGHTSREKTPCSPGSERQKREAHS
ncbi:hypothetical protein DFH94DRAFT_785044 [Russula ochroleuca]|uniref:Uncharacterized protein n=1 Tax=Russula ochroleuca TaxID=152965 RepID=A0A9P5JU72_9AGAM|nr:hypothetical protein DFH94DRAFT_785044 [Russula ochroleuca]